MDTKVHTGRKITFKPYDQNQFVRVPIQIEEFIAPGHFSPRLVFSPSAVAPGITKSPAVLLGENTNPGSKAVGMNIFARRCAFVNKTVSVCTSATCPPDILTCILLQQQ